MRNPKHKKTKRMNPGATWHYDRAGEFEDKRSVRGLSKSQKEEYTSLMGSEYYNMDESRRLGIPNPKRRRKSSMKVMGIPLIPLALIGGLAWIIYKNR